MSIHRDNVLKTHQHISYCFIQREHFKKTMLIENLIEIFTKTHELHIFSKFSRRVACPYMCAADISI